MKLYTEVSMTISMPAMPRTSSARRSRKVAISRPCFCGCGRLTKSTWFPGCDGVMTKWARRIEVLDGKVQAAADDLKPFWMEHVRDTLALVPEASMSALAHTLKRIAGVSGRVDVADPVDDVEQGDVEQVA